jgi:hypothetical protein
MMAESAEALLPEPLKTVTYSLTVEQIEWLRQQGEQQSRRGASGVLREILDAAMDADRAICRQHLLPCLEHTR